MRWLEHIWGWKEGRGPLRLSLIPMVLYLKCYGTRNQLVLGTLMAQIGGLNCLLMTMTAQLYQQQVGQNPSEYGPTRDRR